jgi:uncharacterized protein YbcI
VELLC